MTTELVEKVILEEVVENVIINEIVETTVINEGNVYNLNITNREPNVELLTINTNNQTIFELSETSSNPSKSGVYLNGVKQIYAIDYLIDDVVFTWLSPIKLKTTDDLEVSY